MSVSSLQMRLAHDSHFLDRVQYTLVQQALVVKAESGGTTNHAARAAFADKVLASPAGYAQTTAVSLVTAINLQGTVTNNDDGTVSTSVTDAALLSQVATLWDSWAVSG